MVVLLQINSGIVGSTGTIMMSIDEYAREDGMKTYMASVNNKSSAQDYPSNHICIGSILEKHIHRGLATITGNEGGYSYLATKRFLKKVDEIKPDIIHLHNLHWDYINLGLLFKYLKEHSNIKVVWTLHDCWSYTGHCPYYDMAGCNRWQTQCHDCKVYQSYPQSRIDNSDKMHRRKKEWFLGLPNLSLVTPSKWLNDEVKKSFLKDYDSYIISNGIDTDAFVCRKSDIREEYGLGDKFVVVGSAYHWSVRKGYDCFIGLAKMLDDDFSILLVGGMSEEQEKECDKNGIKHIPFVSSKEKLAEVYSAGDVFFNPTREEMFGLVNIEAEACGTPVITFDSGGSPECIGEECGFVVDKEDVSGAAEKIRWLRNHREMVDSSKIREWACRFEAESTYRGYLELYRNLVGDLRGKS